MVLYDPEGFLIAANDDAGAGPPACRFPERGRNAVLCVALPLLSATGEALPDPSTYRIVVSAVDKAGTTSPLTEGLGHRRSVAGGQYALKVFGGAFSAPGPLSLPELLFPGEGQTDLETSVTFRWKPSTDPIGGAVSYEHCLRENDSNFTGADCTSIDQTASLLNKGVRVAGWGLSGTGLLLLGMALFGGMKSKGKVGFLIAMMVTAGMLLVSCGGGGGGSGSPGDGDGGGGGSASEVTRTVSGLNPGTSYFWKVIAKNGAGESAENGIRSFTTQ